MSLLKGSNFTYFLLMRRSIFTVSFMPGILNSVSYSIEIALLLFIFLHILSFTLKQVQR